MEKTQVILELLMQISFDLSVIKSGLKAQGFFNNLSYSDIIRLKQEIRTLGKVHDSKVPDIKNNSETVI